MKIFVVLVQHADRSAWIDSVYETSAAAEDRAYRIEDDSNWLDAVVEAHELIE